MKLTRPSDVKVLLEEWGVRPSRFLGQNFLIDENILNIALESVRLESGNTVLEIGPGLGVLTEPLLERAGRVIAIEKDAALCAFLRDRFSDKPNFELIEGDAMAANLSALFQQGTDKVVANLPYGVGSRLLVAMAECPDRPRDMVLMLQLDVARRICASPGSREYGLLAIRLQLDYEIKLRKTVSRTCFFPPPDIQSALLTFRLRERPLAEVTNRTFFYRLLKHCFSQRRKQLGHILRSASEELEIQGNRLETDLAAASISPESRPEDVSVVAWTDLSNRLRQGTER